MTLLNKRRDFPNPLTVPQVDENWDKIEFKLNELESAPPGGLRLGETSSTAHRGDRGKHAYDSIIESENYDFANRLLINLNF